MHVYQYIKSVLSSLKWKETNNKSNAVKEKYTAHSSCLNNIFVTLKMINIYLNYTVKTMHLFYIWLLHFCSLANLKIYFRLSWKTWKALFIELVSLFYCIYFLLLLIICYLYKRFLALSP